MYTLLILTANCFPTLQISANWQLITLINKFTLQAHPPDESAAARTSRYALRPNVRPHLLLDCTAFWPSVH